MWIANIWKSSIKFHLEIKISVSLSVAQNISTSLEFQKNELRTQGNMYLVDGLSSLRKVRFKPKVQNSNLKLRNFIIFDIKTQDGVKVFRKFYTRIEPHYFRQVFTKRFSDARNTPGVIGVLPRSFEKFRVILEIF